MNKIAPILFSLLLIFPLYASGKEDSVLTQPVSSPTEEPLKWGVLLLEPQVEGEESPEVISFLNQLHGKLQKYDIHLLQEEEKLHWGERLLEEQMVSFRNQLNAKITERDQLLYSNSDRELKDNEIAIIRESMTELLEAIPQRGPEELTVHIYSLSETQLLYSDDEKKWPVDTAWVISSHVIHQGDSLSIVLYGENLITGRKEILWEQAGNISSLSLWLEEVDQVLRQNLLGRSWAALLLTTEPKDARIYQGESLVGIGRLDIRDLEPGRLDLRISREGYRSRELNLSIFPGELHEEMIELEETLQTLSYITTEPAGADIYLGSHWLGVTPMEIPLPEDNLSLLLHKENYGQIYLPTEDIPPRLELTLQSVGTDIHQEVDVARKKFYNSLAIFCVSLAAPIVLHGMQQNQADLYLKYESDYKSAPTEEKWNQYINAKNEYDTYYYSYGASLGVSGSLFLYSLFRMRQYIKISEKAILEE